MSDRPTLASRVQDALQAHLDANGGGFPTEFLLVSNYIDSEGESSYFLTCSPDQVVSTTLGLLRWGTLAAENDAHRYFNDDDD